MNKDMKYKISENVRNYRERNNLSIRETSRKIKLNYKTTNQLVNMQVNTTRLETVYNLAKSFNVTMDDLLFKNIFAS